jgi:hypothetical protein
MALAPVVLFVYNRPTHTKRVISSLSENRLATESELFVYSDGPRKSADIDLVDDVRVLIRSIKGFRNFHIVEREENRGLSASIISGVSDVIQVYGKVIVVEDDLLLSRNFLTFMNTALKYYENFPGIYSITGFNYPSDAIHIPEKYAYDVYLSYRCMSWGWGTWRDRWNSVDWNVSRLDDFMKHKKSQTLFNRGGEDLSDMLKLQMMGGLDSWAIRWCYAHFQHEAFCLYPIRSFVKNLGFDGSGTHCDLTTKTLPRPELDDNWMASRLLDRTLVVPEIVNSFYKIHKRSLASRIKTKTRLFFKRGML